MTKRMVEYGTVQVEVTTDQQIEQASRGLGINIDARGVYAPERQRSGVAQDVDLESRLASLRQRLTAAGDVSVTAFNFLPWPIVVNSPLAAVQGGLPAARGDSQYGTRTWEKHEIVVWDEGDRRQAQDIPPLFIARAFENECSSGGVVILHGGPEAADRPENQALLKKGAADAVRVMRAKMAEGDKFWNAPDRWQRRNVDAPHRLSAQRLRALNVIQGDPEWIVPEKNLEDVPTVVCVCGKRPESLATIRCSCGYILNVAEAYKRNIITEESEELERLTRAEVIELGVSDYVAETSDEKPKRIKAGVGRPPSKSQERLYEAQMAQEAQERKGSK